jgi:hypothetical protein
MASALQTSRRPATKSYFDFKQTYGQTLAIA